MNIFKKKEPKKKWGDFKKLDYCHKCKHLSEYGDSFGDCCPNCGNEDYKQVIARWEFSWINCGFTMTREYYRSEINENYRKK